MQTITTHYTIPDGAQGTKATLDTMALLARQGSCDASVNQMVDAVLSVSDNQPFHATLHRLEAWLRVIYKFEFDPPEVETIKHPGVMANEIFDQGYCTGDCDDISTLVAALLLNMSIPVRFVAIKAEKGNPEFTHVFVEANLGFYWKRFDLTVEPEFPTIRDYGKMTVNVDGLRC